MSAFLTYLLNGLAVGCAIALIASGLVVIHRVTGVVNFAQGTFAVVAGLCTSSLLGLGFPHGVSEVAARYGVSRQSLHAWLRRYEEGGLKGLADRSREGDPRERASQSHQHRAGHSLQPCRAKPLDRNATSRPIGPNSAK